MLRRFIQKFDEKFRGTEKGILVTYFNISFVIYVHTHTSVNKTNPLNNTVYPVCSCLADERIKQKTALDNRAGITNYSSLPTVRCSVVLSNKITRMDGMDGREGGKKNSYSFHSEKNPIVGGEGGGKRLLLLFDGVMSKFRLSCIDHRQNYSRSLSVTILD
ncbi:hypothetical protein CEXT_813801 [Caerostris extrusa]|uniref:Uncharacterized protein n=1 Tax=Caerostris extrusa TaxID=172846 RepID=A0AAV4WHH5_CAEEX|nr:hypothetical protein CEXT_813801 [Caerostris extrusa]